MTAAFLIRQGIAQEKHHGPQDNDDALGQKILGDDRGKSGQTR